MSITTATCSPSPFSNLPKEIFPITTLANFPNDLVDSIITWRILSPVCKELQNTIRNNWPVFIQQAGKVAFHLNDFPETLNFNDFSNESIEKTYQFIKKRFVVLLNLKNTNPKITNTLLPGPENILDKCSMQLVVNNHLGAPELCAIDNTRQHLIRIDLASQKHSILELKEIPNHVGSPSIIDHVYSKRWVAIFEKWIALSTTDQRRGMMEISIIDISSRGFCHKISGLQTIIQFCSEGDHLYVLGNDESGKTVLLKYDSKDWKASPEKLKLKDNILQFYLGRNELLFVERLETENDYEWQICLVGRNCFSNENPVFFKASLPEKDCPVIKVSEQGFLTLTPDYDREPPCLILKSICMENSFPIEKKLQEFPMDELQPIDDFHILLDKMIIHKQTEADFFEGTCKSLPSFFNLSDGKHIKDFEPEFENLDYNLDASLSLLPDKRIVFLRGTSDPKTHLPIAGMMELDFGI